MILEGINLIYGSFCSFVSVLLKCNRATLALATVAKEKGETYSWFEECPSFLFSIIYHVILSIKSTIDSSKKNMCIYMWPNEWI